MKYSDIVKEGWCTTLKFNCDTIINPAELDELVWISYNKAYKENNQELFKNQIFMNRVKLIDFADVFRRRLERENI